MSPASRPDASQPVDHRLFDELIGAVEDVVLVTHVQPDGDALGSEIGLGRYLLSLGKRVRIVNHDPVSDILEFIADPALPVEHYDPARHDDDLRKAPLIVLVDNSAPDRLGRMEAIMVACADHVLCIDHHPARHAPWRYNIVSVAACATAELIWELTAARGFDVDRTAARALYVGLATDTGFFRFNSTTARGHRIAAALLEAGVDAAGAYRAIYERNTEAFTRLLGHALVGLRLEADGAVASVKVDLATIVRLHAGDEDTSEITTALLAMDGVRVALLFRELDGGRVKVSLRSKGELDVHGLAIEFGGGGHRNASGIVMEGSLDDAETVVLQRATALCATAPS